MNFWAALQRVYGIFFKLGIRKKRTKLFVFLSLVPLLLLGVILLVGVFVESSKFSAPQFFSKIAPAYYTQFLIGIMAIFFSSSILGEEIDDKTLPYLTSRSIPKPAILIGKFFAYYSVMSLALLLGVLVSFIAAHVDRLERLSIYTDFFQFCGAILLALFAYGSVFLFLSTFMKRTVVFGLIYLFGFESWVQYLPGFTQKMTIIHYVKSLVPQVDVEFSFLMVQLEPSSAWDSILTLLIVSAVSLIGAAIIFRSREYII